MRSLLVKRLKSTIIEGISALLLGSQRRTCFLDLLKGGERGWNESSVRYPEGEGEEFAR